MHQLIFVFLAYLGMSSSFLFSVSNGIPFDCNCLIVVFVFRRKGCHRSWFSFVNEGIPYKFLCVIVTFFILP